MLYFAYGSNMDRQAMQALCPKSRVLGLARLAKHRIFIMEEGYASVRSDASAIVHGVLYDLALSDVPVEALGGISSVKAALDHDGFGSNRSKTMNVIDSHRLERDAGGKPLHTFPHPVLGARRAIKLKGI